MQSSLVISGRQTFKDRLRSDKSSVPSQSWEDMYGLGICSTCRLSLISETQEMNWSLLAIRVQYTQLAINTFCEKTLSSELKKPQDVQFLHVLRTTWPFPASKSKFSHIHNFQYNKLKFCVCVCSFTFRTKFRTEPALGKESQANLPLEF